MMHGMRTGRAAFLVALACAGPGCDAVFGIGTLPALAVVDGGSDTVASTDSGVDDAEENEADGGLDCSDASDNDDPANCGTCGHSCLGGACIRGACQPVLLSDRERYPNALAADPGDDGAVYLGDYTTGDAVRIEKDGSARQVLRSEPNANLRPVAMIVDGDLLYWLETSRDTGPTSTVFHMDKKTGGDLDGRVTLGWSESLALAPDGLFWIDRFGPRIASSTPLNFSTITLLASRATGDPGSVWSVAADDEVGGWMYYGCDGNDAGIHRIRKDGSATEKISADTALQLVHWQHELYYTRKGPTGTRQVARMADDGSCAETSCPQVLSTLAVTTRDLVIAVDENDVYIGAPDTNQIVRVLRFGGPMVHLASAVYPNNIAIDRSAIYYTTYHNPSDGTPDVGKVYRLAK